MPKEEGQCFLNKSSQQKERKSQGGKEKRDVFTDKKLMKEVSFLVAEQKWFSLSGAVQKCEQLEDSSYKSTHSRLLDIQPCCREEQSGEEEIRPHCDGKKKAKLQTL